MGSSTECARPSNSRNRRDRGSSAWSKENRVFDACSMEDRGFVAQSWGDKKIDFVGLTVVDLPHRFGTTLLVGRCTSYCM